MPSKTWRHGMIKACTCKIYSGKVIECKTVFEFKIRNHPRWRRGYSWAYYSALRTAMDNGKLIFMMVCHIVYY